LVVRRRLLALPGAERLRAVGNGHLHWYRHARRARVAEVWGPSTGFVGPSYEDMSPPSRCGVVERRLGGAADDTWFHSVSALGERAFPAVPGIVSRLSLLEQRG